MKLFRIIAVLYAVLFIGSQAFCDRISDLEQENAQLRQRVENMEATIQQIQSAMIKEGLPSCAISTAPAVVKTQKCAGMEIYGYIKADAAYDSHSTMVGNFNMWVLPESDVYEDDNHFNLTAKQSRFGINAFGPGFWGGTAFGKIEVDFYGSGAENKAELRMRHAYVTLDWADTQTSLLAGQTWDVVSPLNAPTINFLPLGHAGNPGIRRPQVRVTKGFDITDESKLKFELAASRTIGDIWGADVRDTGEDAAIPTFQGRVSLGFPFIGAKKTVVGVSGLWGKEEYELENPVGDHQDFDTWMVCGDLSLPLTDAITFRGEIWTGENLDTFLAGIGQGINQTTLSEIAATGGWGALYLGPFDKFTFNVGGGVDDPDDGDLNDGMRDKNYAIFGNFWYAFNPCIQAGFELSYWKTEYKNSDDGDSVRAQGALMYIF